MSKIKFLLIYSIVLVYMPAYAQTGHPYYPMNAGQRIKYQLYSFRGYWDEPSMKITITARAPYVPSNPYYMQTISYSFDICPLYFGYGPLYVATYTDPYGASGSLKDGGWIDPKGISYIGEAVNEKGVVARPFIAKLAFNPSQGQEIRGSSVTNLNCNSQQLYLNKPFNWVYRTIEYNKVWGRYTDTWRTGLREFNSEFNSNNVKHKDRVYNYVFQRGVGMVNFWYGDLEDNQSILNGVEYYAIEY